MATVRPIRITKNDREEYNRLARNAKSKISRIKNKYGVDLSGEIEVPKIDSFASRAEFNQFKERAKSFTNRNNTKYQFVENKFGVVASKKEINKIKRDTEKAQRVAKKLTKEATNKPFIAGGKQQGTVGQQMKQMGKPDTAGIVIPNDFDFNKIRTRKQLKAKAESMEGRSEPGFFDKRMEQMKTNFIDALNKTFNSDAHGVAERIEIMSARDFYEMYLTINEFKFAAIYINELLGETTDNFVVQINQQIDMYEQGLYKDLRGF